MYIDLRSYLIITVVLYTLHLNAKANHTYDFIKQKRSSFIGNSSEVQYRIDVISRIVVKYSLLTPINSLNVRRSEISPSYWFHVYDLPSVMLCQSRAYISAIRRIYIWGSFDYQIVKYFSPTASLFWNHQATCMKNWLNYIKCLSLHVHLT